MKITKTYLKHLIKEEMQAIGEISTHEEDMKKYNLVPPEPAIAVIEEAEAALAEITAKFNEFFKNTPVEPEDLHSRILFLKELIGEPDDIEEATTDEGQPACEQCLREYIEKHSNVLSEAKYQGRTVALGKPMKGDVKKSKVYVKNPKTGKVIKVNFGDKKMRIKKSNPGRRKNFRARHNCDNPGPRTKAKYWSCRSWN